MVLSKVDFCLIQSPLIKSDENLKTGFFFFNFFLYRLPLLSYFQLLEAGFRKVLIYALEEVFSSTYSIFVFKVGTCSGNSSRWKSNHESHSLQIIHLRVALFLCLLSRNPERCYEMGSQSFFCEQTEAVQSKFK